MQIFNGRVKVRMTPTMAVILSESNDPRFDDVFADGYTYVRVGGEGWYFDTIRVSTEGPDLAGRAGLNLPLRHTAVVNGMRFAVDREGIVWLSHFSPERPVIDGLILRRPGFRDALVTTNRWAPEVYLEAFARPVEYYQQFVPAEFLDVPEAE